MDATCTDMCGDSNPDVQAAAIELVLQAAGSYYAPALSQLGTMHYTGYGSIKADQRAAYERYWHAAAQLGDPYSWYQMAEAHDPRYTVTYTGAGVVSSN